MELPAVRDVALPRQIAVKLLEQRLNYTRMRQPFTIEPDGLGLVNPVLQPQTKNPHEGQPVAYLILDLVIRQIVQSAQYQHLEHHHRVNRLAPGLRLPLRLRCPPDRSSVGRKPSQGTMASIWPNGEDRNASVTLLMLSKPKTSGSPALSQSH